MKIKLMVNEAGAIRNGRFAFTDKLALLGELLQNARRAGATFINVDFDAEHGRLVVTDNGCGISDFQALLHLNASGWDEAVMAKDQPFGLGFSKVLYSSRHVHITSRGKQLSFNCEEALSQAEMEVTDSDVPDDGLTVLRLEGVDIPDIKVAIARYVRGFPIEVALNGVPLPREHAEDQMDFVDTSIGRVHLAGRDSGQPSSGVALYIQGQLLSRSSKDYYCMHDGLDVVHLDSSKFQARMPDRAELIDANEQLVKITGAIRDEWRSHLLAMKAKLDPGAFIDRFFDVAHRHGLLDVFNDLALLPKQACSVISRYPTLVNEMEVYLDTPSHLSQEAVTSGASRLACLVWFHRRDEESSISAMYARAAGLTLVDPSRVAPGHWALQGLRQLEDEPATATPTGELKTFWFSGHHVSCEVVLCDSIRIDHGTDTVLLSDDALFWEGRILYPKGCTDGQVVEQVSNYCDEHDRFDETACEEDFANLAKQALLWRCPDPASMLAALLRDLPEYPTLLGKRFMVTLPSDRGQCVVEQVS
ncbi:ATP-binding protein [Piscinibacter gummiphilus]|uniref:ATP-binding protein n=1 Tax=Piscinibacter gummiphilus TaxID=946333 RepID=A0ABZ0D1U5_9BURK|nr:ATP-binding protein [Piscinibacter gummiphilus]WOB11153.1 hypothetical protein RXV79_27330 [Piscinibacter gummiphilus]